MNTLSIDSLASVDCGNWIDVTCDIITVGSSVYAIGGIANWWNPIGWICDVAGVASLACFGYWAATKEKS